MSRPGARRIVGRSLTPAQVYEGVVRRLPASLATRVDWLRPSLRDGWGGPLNGQEHRRRIVRDLVREIAFTRIVETGSFRGNTTEFFAQVSGLPVRAIEANPRFADYSRRRCRVYPNVAIVDGDSRAGLAGLSVAPDDTVLYYLDAHWGADLPLRAELDIIAGKDSPAVVLIDDFQVPGDDGYGYDDYGPGKALTEEIIDGTKAEGWSRWYPSVPSSAETGGRRGCIVLAHPALDAAMAKVTSLRSAGA